jgi:hypothetical protein
VKRRVALEAGQYLRCIGVLAPLTRDPRLAGIPLPVQWGEPTRSIDNRRRVMTA